MQTYEDFLAKQKAKYAAIRSVGAETRKKGLRHDPALQKRNGCASIAFSHPTIVAQKAEAFSRAIASAVPALVYEEHDIHITLCSCKTVEGFFPRQRAYELREELFGLLRVVAPVLKRVQPDSVRIEYGGWVHSDGVAMAVGEPNGAYVDVINWLVESAQQQGVVVYPTVDEHITVSRFTAAVPGERLGPFFALMKKEGLCRSIPEMIHIGYSNWDDKVPDATNGHFRPYYSFKFSDL